MTPRSCTDGTSRHLSVDLDSVPGPDGGETGLTLCSTPERPVWGTDQSAIDVAYEMYLSDTHVNIAALPPCAQCLRIADLLADPETASTLHRRPSRPDFASGFTGNEIRSVLRNDIVTGASPSRQAAVHLLTFTAVPDQPGFGDLVGIMDLPWDMGDTVRMGQVTDWAAVVSFAAAADVSDRDRQMIAVAARLADGSRVGSEAVAGLVDDPAATERVKEAIAIASGQGGSLKAQRKR
jgi:hypothetical protein